MNSKTTEEMKTTALQCRSHNTLAQHLALADPFNPRSYRTPGLSHAEWCAMACRKAVQS